MTTLAATVQDIGFKITPHGNLVPDLILDPTVEYRCPNLYTLQKAGVWIGDTVWISPKDKSIEVVKSQRPVDATPPTLPTRCPHCETELLIQLDRRVVVKCPNTRTCPAQNKEAVKCSSN